MTAAIFTIPSGLGFVDALAAGMLAEAKGDPLALAAAEVLLPNRRACRSLREAFLRLSGGRPLLLPRMRAVDAVDEDELALGGDLPFDIPPAISPLERRLLLTRLVMALGGGRGGLPPGPDQAALLADELAALLDAVQIERLCFDRLATLVPDDYAAHWQKTLDFLAILTKTWPAILAERGLLDPQERTNRVIAAQTEAWRRQPPGHPVIAAGTTGSRPATADLLAVVAALPRGRVVLPGLDLDLDEAGWAAIDASHPQAGLKHLLDRLGIARDQVRLYATAPDSRRDRTRLLSEALRPAATAEAWRDLPPISAAALDGVVRLDAPGPREEAGAIALMLRQALETPGRTAALVTADRTLARRVAAELERWDLILDDSAGTPLALTEPGVFLRLLAAMVGDGFAPHATLAALKHPLAAGGDDAARFRATVRRLELDALRGPRPAAGIAGLKAAAPALIPWLDGIDFAAAPFAALMARKSAPLAELVRTHMELAEALAAEARLPGPARLWRGEAGEALAGFVAELVAAAPALGEIPPACYAGLFDALLAGQVVRPAWGRHPRLFLWGPIEARLQHADLVVLGGLNEGTWPPEADSDAWMSRPMRAAFGLPPFERRIGLAAHDFAQAFAAPRVVLTRAIRDGGTPTVPSRWLLRLDTVMRAAGLVFPMIEHGGDWLAWHAQLDTPAARLPAERPAPRPPVEARPRRLSVTEIEKWMRDPYAIYARHVLGLKVLDPIDADPGAGDYGNLVHKALERFLREFRGDLPADAEARLLEIGAEVFAEVAARPGLYAFWWPRFQSVARWFLAREAERRPRLIRSAVEVKGELELAAPAGPFLLHARADRIDLLAEGGLALIDYKTGAAPTKKEVAAGYSPQLPLEAAIARAGGFTDIPAAEISELLFWRLKGGADGGEEHPAGDDPATLATEALAGLEALIAAFDDQATPYEARPHPAMAPKYSDTLHLARVKEWSTGADEGDE